MAEVVPLVAPVLSLDHTTPDTVRVSWTAATDGTAPYTYDVHRSLTKGFVPAVATKIATSAASPYNDSESVVPDAFMHYRVVVNDAQPAAANSNEVTAVLKHREFTGRRRR